MSLDANPATAASQQAPAPRRNLRVGLTGGIGSGKSTVAQMLVDCGAHLVDTDAISRALTAAGGAAMPALCAEFGADMATSDGALDRERMRSLVFKEPAARQRLEQILHPLIGLQTQQQADAAGPVTTVVFDVPLLAESAHWRGRVDRILVVDCLEATQVQRVMQRSGWDEETVRRVISQQASRTERRRIADAVIFNEGLALPALRSAVRSLWVAWHAKAG